MNVSLKRFVSKLSIVTLLVGLLAPLGNVQAAAIVAGNARDEMTRQKVSVLSDHDIRFENSTAVNASTDTITLSFNDYTDGADGSNNWTLAAFALANFDLAAGDTNNCDTATFTEKTLAASAGAGAWGVGIAGQVVTFTAPTDAGATEIAANKCIRIRIGSNAATGGAGTSAITNPAVATDLATPTTNEYEIAIAGTFGDAGEIEVPIFANDQVVVNATVDTYINFGVTTSAGSDNTINLGELRFDNTTSSNDAAVNDNISLTIDSNGYGGVKIDVKSTNAGLIATMPSNGSHLLDSATETLAPNALNDAAAAGYGIRVASVSTAGGSGTLQKVSPYDNADGDSVGIVDTSWRNIIDTPADNQASSPIVSGVSTVHVVAVPGKNTPAADNYTDTLTFRATATF